MEIPWRVSRTWGRCTLMDEAELETPDGRLLRYDGVVCRLQRRDDPTGVVLVLIPHEVVADVSVDLWAIVSKRAAVQWRRMRRVRGRRRRSDA